MEVLFFKIMMQADCFVELMLSFIYVLN